jgi:hypothetical protein
MSSKTTLAGLCVLLLASGARAEIVATSGAAVQIAAPPSVELNVLQSDTEIRVFDEQQAVTLSDPLTVDISLPGVYEDPADLTPAVIPAGTQIDSHLVHFDIVFAGTAISAEGTVTFRDRILGVILEDADVDASDFLGATGTAYPPAGLVFRGAELFETDLIEVGCNTVRVEIESFETLDHIRVITARDDGSCDGHQDGEGCSHGYWKQCDSRNKLLALRRIFQWLRAGVLPIANVNRTFGVRFFPNVDLCDATNLNGGGVRKLAREGVAALLNAKHPKIDYPLTPGEVVDLVRKGDADTLAELNELGCPLH